MSARATFPVAYGLEPTEAHARACRESGHPVWAVDGRDIGICPRCGVVTIPATVHTLTIADLSEDTVTGADLGRMPSRDLPPRCPRCARRLELAGVLTACPCGWQA